MSVSGAFLSAEIEGVEIAGVFAWTADSAGGDVLDATTGQSGGATDTDTGCADLRVTMRLVFDLLTGMGFDLAFGDILTNLRLFRNAGDANPAYLLPRAIVIADPESVEVRGRITFDIVCKNKGPFSRSRY